MKEANRALEQEINHIRKEIGKVRGDKAGQHCGQKLEQRRGEK